MSKKILALMLASVVLVSLFIFSNSLKVPAVTNADSGAIVRIVKNFTDKYISLSFDQLNFIVRKCAHLFEFSLLGISVMTLFLVLKRKGFGYCLFYVLFIAVIDEHIQSYMGRTSRTADILIDFTGALTGIIFVYLIYLTISYIRNKRKNHDCGRR